MKRSNTYQLTCSHCGEFISIDNISTTENIINNSLIGEIKISNVELTCPRCHYMFKASVSKNSDL